MLVFSCNSDQNQFQIITALIYRHSRAGGNPSLREENWIPACAGTTELVGLLTFDIDVQSGCVEQNVFAPLRPQREKNP